MRFPFLGPLLPTVLTVLFFLAACAKEGEVKTASPAAENPNAIQRSNLHKAYGLPFEIKPINSMRPEVRKAAEAVVFVRYADGGSATGFFVSEDGLLLTNEHVVSRSSCLRQRCAGIQLIRDFRHGGAHEVFEDFEFLAASSETDISLVRVKLAPGKKVPFLRLSAKKPEKEDSLILLGHPGGASLHASASRLHQARNVYSRFLSLAVGGNSGGPIVDAKSLEVVAVINAINRRDERIDREGVAYGYGLGTLIPVVEKTLKVVDPSFNPASPRFVLPAAALSAAQSEVAAPLKFEGEPTLSQFVRTALGTESELPMLQELLKIAARKTFAKEEINGILETIVTVDVNRGKKLAVTQELLSPYQPEGYSAPHSAKVRFFGQGPDACLKELAEYTEITEFALVGADCQQTQNSKGTDAFVLLREYYEAGKGQPWGDRESHISLLLLGVESQLGLRPSLKKEDAELVKAVLKKIGTDAPVMRQYFTADRLLTMVAEKPELVAPGSFKSL